MDYHLIILEFIVKALVITLVCSYNIQLGSAVGLYFGWKFFMEVYGAYRHAKISGAVIKAMQEIKNNSDDEELH